MSFFVVCCGVGFRLVGGKVEEKVRKAKGARFLWWFFLFFLELECCFVVVFLLVLGFVCAFVIYYGILLRRVSGKMEEKGWMKHKILILSFMLFFAFGK